jgi:DNA-binding response OmpR family regulator
VQSTLLLIEAKVSTASALTKVIEAEGQDATASARDFDLAITDLRLPGLGGMDLITELPIAKPKLPFISAWREIGRVSVTPERAH